MAIVLTTTSDQTLLPNQSLIFSRDTQTGCDVAFRNNSGSLVTRFNSLYDVAFTGNISVATADQPIELSVEVSGTPFFTMQQVPGVADAPVNVAGYKILNNLGCCCGNNVQATITVTNTGTNALTVASGASLSVAAKRS